MSEPKRDEVEAQLRLILATPAFARSPHLSRFLQFTAERTLDGRADEIKEYLIGSEVLRPRSRLDPRTDTIVRIRRLTACGHYCMRIIPTNPIRPL
ncbi:MAG: hypothetical protein QM757_05330 [Paludibaculum sp.]